MPERQRDFLSDLFQALADRSRKLLRSQQNGNVNAPLEELAEASRSSHFGPERGHSCPPHHLDPPPNRLRQVRFPLTTARFLPK